MDEAHVSPEGELEVAAGIATPDRRWVPAAVLVALLGLVGMVVFFADDGGRTRTVFPAATTDVVMPFVATAIEPTTVAIASTGGGAESSTQVAPAATSSPSTTSNAPLPVSTSSTRPGVHTVPPTTVNSPTECLEGCTFGPVGTSCVSMPISVVLSDPEGVTSAVIDWSYPSGGKAFYGQTVLTGPTGAGFGEWGGTVRMPAPPELNFFGTISAIDGAGAATLIGWQIPAPLCGSSETVQSTSTAPASTTSSPPTSTTVPPTATG